MTTETPFLVDRNKHRIVKRDGVWKLYCPLRGTNNLVLAKTYDVMLKLNPVCPHPWSVY